MSLVTAKIMLGVVPWVGSSTAYVGQPPHEASPSFRRVSKTVVSSKMRLIFMVGLEGTGHHYIFKAESTMHLKNATLPQIGDFELDDKLYNPLKTMNLRAERFKEQEVAAKAEMAELARRAEMVSWPGTMMFQHGGISYPNGHGRMKVFNYMDMRLMAEVAEAEGVDYRVLYLRRSAKDIIVANTVHRDFQDMLEEYETNTPEGRFMDYIKILFTDMGVMHSFLGEIDPAFVVCHDWDYLGNADQAKAISEFIAPTAEIASLFEKSLVDTVTPIHRADISRRATDFPPGTGAVVARLQQKLDAFESLYCGSSRQFAT